MVVGSVNHFMDYAVDVANGEQDGESSATSPGNATENTKAMSARAFFVPWQKSNNQELKQLGFGIAGGWDNETGGDTQVWNNISTSLGGFKFINYSVQPAGDFWHWNPEMYYFLGNFGFQTELVQSAQAVSVTGKVPITLTNASWMVEANWVFGGKPTYQGPIIDNEFDMAKGHWGAFQIAARVCQLYIDSNSFYYGQPFSGAEGGLANGVQLATSYGLAFNWFFNTHFKTMVDFERTDFSGGNTVYNSEEVLMTNMAFIL